MAGAATSARAPHSSSQQAPGPGAQAHRSASILRSGGMRPAYRRGESSSTSMPSACRSRGTSRCAALELRAGGHAGWWAGVAGAGVAGAGNEGRSTRSRAQAYLAM